MASKTTPQPPAPPAGLSVPLLALWGAVHDGYEMTAAERRVLADAMILCQRADQAAEAVAEHGVTVSDRYGTPKTNPAVEIEVRCRTAAARLLHQLRLDEAVEQVGRRRAGR